MPNLERITIGEFEWPKRGRRSKPVPEQLEKALTESFINDGKIIPHLDMPSAEVAAFGRMLNSAGRKLNMRIDRQIEPDVPQEGYSRYHFRSKARRNKDEE